MLPTLTVQGRLVADPELRFTAAGVAVTSVRLVATDRKKVGDTWEDGDKLWITVTCWKQHAENVAEQCRKGDEVLATGRIATREWETKEGEKRSQTELQFGTVAKVCNSPRTERTSGGASSQNYDPWAVSATAANDEPPF